ncbi:MAG: energy transducer TonB [Puniceicoccaceae bacterium]
MFTTRCKSLLLCLLAVTLSLQLVDGAFKSFSSWKLTSKGSDDQWHPAVGINGYKPVIMTDEGLGISTNGWMRCAPTRTVNDQFVKISSLETVSRDNGLTLEVKLQSSHALEDAFAIVSFLLTAPNGNTFMANNHSPAFNLTGEEQVLRLNFRSTKIPEDDWMLHIYHLGKELYNVDRTDLRDATVEEAFAVQLDRHLFNVGAGDSPLRPFHTPVSKPEDNLLPATEGTYSVNVKLVIGPDGQVSNYSFEDSVPEALQAHLSESIEDWLFLPAVKLGQPVEKRVVIPLKLK